VNIYVNFRLFYEGGDKVNKKMKHSDLLRKTHHYLGLNEFTNAINTLVEADLIEIERIYTKNATKPTKIYVYKG